MALLTYHVYSKAPVHEDFEHVSTLEQEETAPFNVMDLIHEVVTYVLAGEGSNAIIEVRDNVDNVVLRIGPQASP